MHWAEIGEGTPTSAGLIRDYHHEMAATHKEAIEQRKTKP